MTARERVYINGRFLTQNLSGMQRYAEELLDALDAQIVEDPALSARIELVVLAPKGVLLRRPKWRHATLRRVGRLKGHGWEQIELGRHARDGVLLSLGGTGPILHKRHIVVLHDANVFVNPGQFSRSYGMLHRALRPLLARRAARLATISRFSAVELARCCKVAEEAFTIIPNSAEHILRIAADPKALGRFGLVQNGYLLAVGNHSANKGISLALEAMGRTSSTLPLVVAGGGGAAFAKMAPLVGERVRLLGRVSDEELRSLYERAAAFVFPSRYEGFGVPPLEAMMLGCAVISSDKTAMPEVLGNAPIYFSGGDAGSLAQAIDYLLSSDAVRADHIGRGRERASLYSWASSAEKLLALISAV